MTPVERVARAIYAELAKNECVGAYRNAAVDGFTMLDGDFDLTAVARAAIEALRPELQAARDHIEGVTGARPGSDSEEVVQMISAALAEGE